MLLFLLMSLSTVSGLSPIPHGHYHGRAPAMDQYITFASGRPVRIYEYAKGYGGYEKNELEDKVVGDALVFRDDDIKYSANEQYANQYPYQYQRDQQTRWNNAATGNSNQGSYYGHGAHNNLYNGNVIGQRKYNSYPKSIYPSEKDQSAYPSNANYNSDPTHNKITRPTSYQMYYPTAPDRSRKINDFSNRGNNRQNDVTFAGSDKYKKTTKDNEVTPTTAVRKLDDNLERWVWSDGEEDKAVTTTDIANRAVFNGGFIHRCPAGSVWVGTRCVETV